MYVYVYIYVYTHIAVSIYMYIHILLNTFTTILKWCKHSDDTYSYKSNNLIRKNMDSDDYNLSKVTSKLILESHGGRN